VNPTERIQAAVDACPLTRTRVLDLAGIPHWTWQRRKRNPEMWRYREVVAIAVVLRTTYGELMGDWFGEDEDREGAA